MAARTKASQVPSVDVVPVPATEVDTVGALDPSAFIAYVGRAGRSYTESVGALQSITYDAALATREADVRGIIKADRKAATQGETSTEWAARFGVVGSSAASRVTLWRRLGAAAAAGVTRDSEVWGLLVSNDRANKDGVRQAIESGDLATIVKAATAKAAGEKTGLEEGKGRGVSIASESDGGSGEDVSDAPSIIDFNPGNIVAAVEVLLTRLGILAPEMTDDALAAVFSHLTEAAEMVEAIGHKRAAAADQESRGSVRVA